MSERIPPPTSLPLFRIQGLLPRSQESHTDPCPGPAESCPHHLSYSLRTVRLCFTSRLDTSHFSELPCLISYCICFSLFIPSPYAKVITRVALKHKPKTQHVSREGNGVGSVVVIAVEKWVQKYKLKRYNLAQWLIVHLDSPTISVFRSPLSLLRHILVVTYCSSTQRTSSRLEGSFPSIPRSKLRQIIKKNPPCNLSTKQKNFSKRQTICVRA